MKPIQKTERADRLSKVLGKRKKFEKNPKFPIRESSLSANRFPSDEKQNIVCRGTSVAFEKDYEEGKNLHKIQETGRCPKN